MQILSSNPNKANNAIINQEKFKKNNENQISNISSSYNETIANQNLLPLKNIEDKNSDEDSFSSLIKKTIYYLKQKVYLLLNYIYIFPPNTK